jgi:SAM-dependent methyltransferase
MTKDAGAPGAADNWANAQSYEAYVGRWSRIVAREFVAWLAIPPDRRWLDIGCGTGALSDIILHDAPPKSVAGLDSSEEYISFARQSLQDTRAAFHVGAVESLPFSDGAFDAVVSGLVLNFLPHVDRAVAEMRRVVAPGGTVAAYVWDYAGDMEFMRYFWDAAVALDPKAAALDEGRRFPLCHPEPLMHLFTSAGLQKVETRAIDVSTLFRDFEDFWSPFLGGQGPAPTYLASLSPERRNELREELLGELPMEEEDGSIHLNARAWAVKGQQGR